MRRVFGHPPFCPTTCCTDCGCAHRYRRNNLRRRVKPEPTTCIQCGELFAPRRADAQTCSNKCRQALHREGLREARRKLPRGWRRRPLPDCPMCKGQGNDLVKSLWTVRRQQGKFCAAFGPVPVRSVASATRHRPASFSPAVRTREPGNARHREARTAPSAVASISRYVKRRRLARHG
jgi:predicted nucleic acid-binding Zn ribbon protein